MDDRQHEAIARWERRWLALAGFLSIFFILLIAFSLATEGAHIAQPSGRTTPAELASHPLFASPGLTALGPDRYQLSIVGQAFNFTPAEVVLPVGAEVEFFLTSRDVLHGYQVQNTAINVELIPGEIASLRYTFDKAGEYRVTCNEYCGIGHQNMMGRITVLSAAEFAHYQASQEPQPQAQAEGGAPSGPSGEAIFGSNCVACHQVTGEGLPGVFPPLARHAAEVFAAQGTDLAGRDYLIDVLLYGLQGEISVEGNSYNGAMPAWQQLDDAQIAAVLDYVLAAWGNDALLESFTPYQPEEIAVRRGAGLTAADVHQQRQALGLE